MDSEKINMEQLKGYLINSDGLTFEEICMLLSIENNKRNRVVLKSLLKYESEIEITYNRLDKRIVTIYVYKNE